MQGRGGQTQGNGNGRGVQGRPEIRARETSGEAKVIEIFVDNKAQIMGLLATESNAEGGFLRAQSLAVAAYRKAQADSDVKIDELSMCTCCIWALRQKLDVGTEVWPVPYKGKITPIISPDGMITLIMRWSCHCRELLGSVCWRRVRACAWNKQRDQAQKNG